MAASSRMSSQELLIPKKSWTCNNRNGNRGLITNNSPDRSPIWIEPNSRTTTAGTAVVSVRKVPVLYYLTRNGHLEHPHLIDVPLSSPRGLYLRDVINTLNYHRGKGMANLYSWSFKRSYKNGYVWHDASEDDLIQRTNGHDYVLKGSELLQTHASQNPPETYHTGDNCSSTAMVRRRNQSWSSFDNPQEYLAVKCESSRELAAKFAHDAATETEDQSRLPSFRGESKEHVTVELSREEIPSPPPSNSSSEVSEQTAKVADRVRTVDDPHNTSGRMKASQVLMQLITCGADSVRDVSTIKSKHDQGCKVRVEHGKTLRSEAQNQ